MPEALPNVAQRFRAGNEAINHTKSRRDGPHVLAGLFSSATSYSKTRPMSHPCSSSLVVFTLQEKFKGPPLGRREACGPVRSSLRDLGRFLCPSPSAEALGYYRKAPPGRTAFSAEVNDWVTCTDE